MFKFRALKKEALYLPLFTCTYSPVLLTCVQFYLLAQTNTGPKWWPGPISNTAVTQ